MKILYMVQRPTSTQDNTANDFWTTVRSRFAQNSTKMDLVGIFEDEPTAGLVSKPGDQILRVPCFKDVQDYKQWRDDRVRQNALSKLSEAEKQALNIGGSDGKTSQTDEQGHSQNPQGRDQQAAQQERPAGA